MKAIEIIRAMIYDSELAEFGGLMLNDGSVTLRDYFGAVSHKGTMEYGNYFYVYLDQIRDSIVILPEQDPDVRIQTEDAGEVWLWKVEE